MDPEQLPPFDPALLEPRTNAFIPHQATPRQAAFLVLDCREAFYGGAGGGGKSDALLTAALQYVDVPGYNALIIRRNLPDLAMPGALIDRAHMWLGRRDDAHWDEAKKRWTFASGATVSFGYLEGARDSDRYASAEFHFIGVDELTQFSEKQYLDLFARLRAAACRRCEFESVYQNHRETVHLHPTTSCSACLDLEDQRRASCGRLAHLPAAHIPLRMRSASNPGNIGHDWVKRRFILRLGAPVGERLFVPARLDDNPFINREEYVQSLLNLDPVTALAFSRAIGKRARCAACSSASGSNSSTRRRPT